jgi:hypothetical protein
LATCQYKYESDYPAIKFACNEPSITNSQFCIFHDKDHYAEYEQKAAKRFEEKVKESIEKKKPLECFGYYLPHINFKKLLERKSFALPVSFIEATFYKRAKFQATFYSEVNFSHATFKEVTFSGASTMYRTKPVIHLSTHYFLFFSSCFCRYL